MSSNSFSFKSEDAEAVGGLSTHPHPDRVALEPALCLNRMIGKGSDSTGDFKPQFTPFSLKWHFCLVKSLHLFADVP